MPEQGKKKTGWLAVTDTGRRYYRLTKRYHPLYDGYYESWDKTRKRVEAHIFNTKAAAEEFVDVLPQVHVEKANLPLLSSDKIGAAPKKRKIGWLVVSPSGRHYVTCRISSLKGFEGSILKGWDAVEDRTKAHVFKTKTAAEKHISRCIAARITGMTMERTALTADGRPLPPASSPSKHDAWPKPKAKPKAAAQKS